MFYNQYFLIFYFPYIPLTTLLNLGGKPTLPTNVNGRFYMFNQRVGDSLLKKNFITLVLVKSYV